MEKPDLLALDWNGNLFDDREYAWGAVKTIFTNFNTKPPSPDAFFDATSADYVACYKRFGIPEHVTKEELNEVWRRYFSDHRNTGQLRPGVRELLALAKQLGLKTAVVSGEASSVLQKRLDELNLRQMIETAWADCHNKGESLKKLSAQSGIAPGRIVYVDDNFQGLVEARSIGAITIGFTGGWQTPGRISQANPHFLAGNMHVVRGIIKKLQEQKVAI